MKHILIFLVKIYKKILSPMKRKATCKYYPSCSTYAVDALMMHGAFKGLWLAGNRLLRCNPWSLGGVDYVPRKFTFRFKGNNSAKCENYGKKI